jgi:hypothetical protein
MYYANFHVEFAITFFQFFLSLFLVLVSGDWKRSRIGCYACLNDSIKNVCKSVSMRESEEVKGALLALAFISFWIL